LLGGSEMNWTIGSMDGPPLIVDDVDDAWLAVDDPRKNEPFRIKVNVNPSSLCDCGFVRNHGGPCKTGIDMHKREDRWELE
jgi:hypothetical protein